MEILTVLGNAADDDGDANDERAYASATTIALRNRMPARCTCITSRGVKFNLRLPSIIAG